MSETAGIERDGAGRQKRGSDVPAKIPRETTKTKDITGLRDRLLRGQDDGAFTHGCVRHSPCRRNV
jgi:hypothetical protein